MAFSRKKFEGMDLTPEQLEKVRRFRLKMVPVRLFFAYLFFSLVVGGPTNLFTELPGVTFAALYALQLALERGLQSPNLGGKRRDRRSTLVLWNAFQITSVVAMVDWYWIRPHWAVLDWSWIWVAVGAGIFLLGQGLRVVAIRTLGRFFTISVRLHSEQKLITAGIYSLLRHPAYTGLLLVSLGFVTIFGSALGYIAFVLLAVPALLFRVRVEEAALRENFPQEYPAYSGKTKKLIPFIY